MAARPISVDGKIIGELAQITRVVRKGEQRNSVMAAPLTGFSLRDV
jgi:hypothetical protein